MAAIVVSMHAEATIRAFRNNIRGVKLVPLQDRTVHFLVKEREELDDDLGWQGYELLMKEEPDFDGFAQLPGYNKLSKVSMPDYFVSGDDTWMDQYNQKASGIFFAGDPYHQYSPVYVGSAETLRASQILSEYTNPGDDIYWLCCRYW